MKIDPRYYGARLEKMNRYTLHPEKHFFLMENILMYNISKEDTKDILLLVVYYPLVLINRAQMEEGQRVPLDPEKQILFKCNIF